MDLQDMLNICFYHWPAHVSCGRRIREDLSLSPLEHCGGAGGAGLGLRLVLGFPLLLMVCCCCCCGGGGGGGGWWWWWANISLNSGRHGHGFGRFSSQYMLLFWWCKISLCSNLQKTLQWRLGGFFSIAWLIFETEATKFGSSNLWTNGGNSMEKPIIVSIWCRPKLSLGTRPVAKSQAIWKTMAGGTWRDGGVAAGKVKSPAGKVKKS